MVETLKSVTWGCVDLCAFVIDCVTVSFQVCRVERLHLVRTKKGHERGSLER